MRSRVRRGGFRMRGSLPRRGDGALQLVERVRQVACGALHRRLVRLRVQRARVGAIRAARDEDAWRKSLETVRRTACDGGNLVPPIIDAVRAKATIGEISDVLREMFGEHRENFAV